MAANSSMAIAVTTGAAALCGGIFAWKVLSKYNRLESGDGKDLSEIARSIDIDAVGALLNSGDYKVRKSAELFLLDRASSQENLTYILRQCLCKNIDEAVKAVTVTCMLSKASDELKKKLINLNAISTLCDVIKNISNNFDYKYLISNMKNNIKIEEIFNSAMGGLFHLILRDTLITLKFSKNELFIKNILLNIICDYGFHLSNDVKRWTIYMIHQIILCSDKHQHHVKKSLIKIGVINKVTMSLVVSLGDILLTHMSLQILVQYLNDASNSTNKICKEIISLGIVPHLVGLLRCEEDDNVIQLSAIIIHHICCCDLEIEYLTSIPSMVNILFTVLNNTNATIQKTILRICNYLCVGSSKFHKLLVENEPLVKRLSVCLSSGNPEVLLGSLMLVHDLIMPGKEYAYKIITMNPDILKALVKLSLSYTGETVQLIPETLGFICACESLHSLILKYGVLNAILHFAKSFDAEVQFWASALLLNLSMISDEVKETIIRSGGLHILLEMAVSGDEHELPDIATNATKTLVMMGFLDATMDVKLVSGREGGIIVDGTEYCPGKQGINLVVFDFINYQFHKGRVIDTSELVEFFEKPEFIISDSVFLVTQGDCTMSEIDAETMKKYFKDGGNEGEGNFSSPSWCWLYMPSGTNIKFSEDNLQLTTKIHMKDLFAIVLEENFTDPLIDVILTIPASSNIDNLEELGLIEILARHYHQRKAIVSTANLLEYLFELIWRVSSLKSNEYEDEIHKIKLAHSLSALKIIHSCSNDKFALKELITRGLLQPMVSLLQSITVYCCNKDSKLPTTLTKISDFESSFEESPFVSRVNDESIAKDVHGSITPSISESIYEQIPGDGSYLVDCIANLSYSDDNIFQSAIDSQQSASSFPRSASNVRFANAPSPNDFESSETNAGITEDGCSTPTRLQSRNRTDSFIVRTDSQNRMNQDSMLQRRNTMELQRRNTMEEESTDAPSGGRRASGITGRINSRRSRGMSLSQTPSDPHQLRRISRSMSLSLQQAKYTEEYSPEKKCSNDTLNTMGKYIVMITYNMIQNADTKNIRSMLTAHLLPFLYGYLGCVHGLHHKCVRLAISSSLLHLSSVMSDSKEEEMEGVFVRHVDTPRSIVISPDGLEIFNENWYFESVLANQPIGKQLYGNEENVPAGWYYEVQIITDGVIQIGWANQACKFYPEKGCGVGDSVESCGYDGARKKIWNGPCRDVMRENEYGSEWQPGDVISVLLSWDGVLNYWLNGTDMGVALSDMDTDKLWYPAVSIAISQHCIFYFKESTLRYKPPANYTTVTEVNTRFQTKVQPPVTNEEIIHLLNDILITDSGILSDSTDTFLSFYYELDMHQLSENSDITIGYTLFNNALSQHIDSNVVRIVKTLPATVLFDGELKRLNTVGCGILSNMCFIMTIDGEKIFEKPLNDMSNKDFEFNCCLFDTIPYVSNSRMLVNFGQDDFTYNYANSSRYKFIDNLCRLQDNIENES